MEGKVREKGWGRQNDGGKGGKDRQMRIRETNHEDALQILFQPNCTLVAASRNVTLTIKERQPAKQ